MLRNPLRAFARGSEAAHYSVSTLARAAITALLVASLIAAAVAFAWTRATLTPRARQHISAYFGASLGVQWMPSRVATYTIDGHPVRASHADAAKLLRRMFDARSLGFLGRQFFARFLVVAIAITALLGAAAIFYGGAILSNQRLRGARLDVRRKHSVRWAAWWQSAIVGIGMGTTAFAVDLSTAERAYLGDYLIAHWAQRSALIRRLVSPAKAPTQSWYAIGETRGFIDHAAVTSHLQQHIYGRSLGWLAVEWVLYVVLMGGMVHGAASFLGGKRRRTVAATSGKAGDTHSTALLQIGDVPIAPEQETKHFLITGSTGSGKSVAIHEMMRTIRQRGQKALVFDVGGIALERFYDPTQDIVLNPRDARSARWTLWADVRREDDYRRYGKSLFPGSAHADPFWSNAGGVLFAHVARLLHDQRLATNAALYDYLACSQLESLHHLLKGTPAARYVDPSAGDMPHSVIATVVDKLEPWAELSDPPQGVAAFSVRDWVASETSGWLFLTAQDEDLPTLRPLLSLWIEITALALQSLPPDPHRRLWFFLDEIAALQRLPALKPILERGRKYGAACVLGLQAISQIREEYGRDGAQTLLGQPQTLLVLRSAESETAKWLEQQLGYAEVQEIRTNAQVGGRDSTGFVESVRTEPIVMASEITTLADLQGYLKVPGVQAVRPVRYHYVDYPRHHPAFVAVQRGEAA